MAHLGGGGSNGVFFFWVAAHVVSCLTLVQAMKCRQAIDFSRTITGDVVVPGQRIHQGIQFDGVTFQGRSRTHKERNDLFNDAMIVNASLWDLMANNNNGNVLVVTPNNGVNPWQGGGGGGEILIEFDEPVSVSSIDLLAGSDNDKLGDRVIFFDQNGSRLGRIPAPRGKLGSRQTLEIGKDGVQTMVVFFRRVSAIDNLIFRRDCSKRPQETGTSPQATQLTTRPGDPLQATVPLFDPVSTSGMYKRCMGLQEDLVQALRFYASSVIADNANSASFGGGPNVFGRDEDVSIMSRAPGRDDTNDDNDNGNVMGGVESNKARNGGDPADIVKSDGQFVYLGYGDTLVVWDAASGTVVSRTVLPRLAAASGGNGPAPRVQIMDLLLDEKSGTLVVIVSLKKPLYGSSLFEESMRTRASSRLVSDLASLHVRMYNTVVLQHLSGTDGPPMALPLVASKDFAGYYVDGRSIGGRVHLVTVTCLDVWSIVRNELQAWQPRFSNVTSAQEFVESAMTFASFWIPRVAGQMVAELRESGVSERCDNMLRFAAFATMDAKNSTGISMQAMESFRNLPLFQKVGTVISFDMDEVSSEEAISPNKFDEVTRTVDTDSISLLLPLWASMNLCASGDRLVLTADGHHWNEESWSTSSNTFLLAFRLRRNSRAKLTSVGLVEGTVLHKDAIDLYSNHLRVVTTSQASWGCLRFGLLDVSAEGTTVRSTKGRGKGGGGRFCEEWGQVSEVKNQLVILHLEDADGRGLKQVGRLDDLGKANEMLFSARFEGPHGFAVGFHTDPFHVLNLSNPKRPTVVCKLEASGSGSKNLHYLDNGRYAVTITQDKTADGGQIDGLKVALFDITTFGSPSLLDTHVVQQTDEWNWAEVSYDTEASRYVEEAQRLFLPVTLRDRSTENVTDGFMIFKIHLDNVGVEADSKLVEYCLTINHSGGEFRDKDRCYSPYYLPSRSALVGNKATTVKGHSILSFDVETHEQYWVIDLDKDRPRKSNSTNVECSGWFP